MHARGARRPVGLDGGREHAARLGQTVEPCNTAEQRNILPRDAQVASTNVSVPEQCWQHGRDCPDGHRKAQTLAAGNDRRVHANDLSGSRHERSARVTRIQGGVRLNDVIDEPAAPRAQRSAERAYDARRNRRLEAIRIADRDHHLTGLQQVRVTKLHRRKLSSGDSNHGNVGIRILPDHIRLVRLAIGQGDLDLSCPVNDVAVGQDQPFR